MNKVVIALALAASASAEKSELRKKLESKLVANAKPLERADGIMAPPSDLSKDNSLYKYAFDSFKKQYKKQYSSDEEEGARLINFIQNLKIADARNVNERKAKGRANHGVTKFSDLSQAEFEAKFLTADPKLKSTTKTRVELAAPDLTADYVDWTGVYTTPVKNQVRNSETFELSPPSYLFYDLFILNLVFEFI